MAIQPVKVTHLPRILFLERGIFQQSVNFEFQFKTISEKTMELQEITVGGFDEKGNFLFKLPLNNFGLVPSISIIPVRRLEPGKILGIFNPLSDFPLEYPIYRLDYQFKFSGEEGDQAKPQISIYPEVYKQRVKLILPFTGKCLVTEGHNFLTHHSRNFPFTHPLIQQIRITGNSSRFAYDFVPLDEKLKPSKDQPRRNEDFYGWDKPVICPGEGKITGVERELPDNDFSKPPGFDVQAHLTDSEGSMAKHFGNYTLIDHGNNEFSVLAHMRKESVQKELGDKVSKGDVLGRIGTSGDSFFPHLHYQVQNGKSFLESEGLPSSFGSFDLLLGDKTKTVSNSSPNTGMIIAQQSQPKA